MVAVGELFLSAFIQMLVQQLLYPELVKFASREGIGQKLHKWKKTLSRIQAVLDDAEDRQDNNDREVKQWLDNLQDLAYDVDDILDEFNTEVLRSKTMGENRASTSKGRAKSLSRSNQRRSGAFGLCGSQFTQISGSFIYLTEATQLIGSAPNRPC